MRLLLLGVPIHHMQMGVAKKCIQLDVSHISAQLFASVQGLIYHYLHGPENILNVLFRSF